MNVGLPNKSGVNDLKIDPKSSNILYARSSVGFFKSVDGGEYWREIPTGVNSGYVFSLAISTSAELYMTIYPDGIFKSIDGGETWQALSSAPIATVIYSMTIDTATPTTFYVSVENGYIFKSTDSGKTWRLLNTRVNMSQVYSLVVDPIKPTTLYAETANGLFKSTDGGDIWSKKLSCSIITYVRFDPITPTTMYTACIYDSHYQSTDGGESWKKFNLDKYISASDPLNSNTVYSTSEGLFKSIDGGVNWQELKTGFEKVACFTIDPKNSNTIYAKAQNDVLLKSTNVGKTGKNSKLDLKQPGA